MFRIGFGYDVHRLEEGRKLILGEVEIPHHKGLQGHSDADILLHAITDAILGALAEGDIGRHFPDSATENKNRRSSDFLKFAAKLMQSKGYQLQNVDTTIVAQKPKLAEYISTMRENIARILDVPVDKISVKATTSEQLGFVGREEGFAVHAVVLVQKLDT